MTILGSRWAATVLTIVAAAAPALPASAAPRPPGPGVVGDVAGAVTGFADTVLERQGACTAAYRVTDSWNGGFEAEVTVRAGAREIGGWTVEWTLAPGQRVTRLWNGTLSVSGQQVVVRNVSHNATVPARRSVTFGFSVSGPAAKAPSLSCTSP
ncbi:cellulose binding domain-containing protein [Streptomyces sp. NPDC049555]|uniref:cellulose binding domain-containing protein n=1 Tax=Streptomyces sp. NPDC049555 TaxID=3154930 RepID=UPI00343A6FDE